MSVIFIAQRALGSRCLIIVNSGLTINNTFMLKVILSRSLFLAGFKVDKFDSKDYKTMCSLIKQKFPVYNEAIELNKDVKLVDERGKLIGQYTASEARKKAATMKKDILLVNPRATPAICKLENFRQSILTKFYEEVVNKRNEQLIKKASSSKQLKISTNLSENELQIKAKQIIELAKKNFNVRVYSICKNEFKDEGLSTFDQLKSLVMNRCIVETDVAVSEFVEKDEEEFQSKKKEAEKETKTNISMVLRSKENEFADMLTETSEKDPESALEIFLKRYYKQEDVEMRDLKATSQQIEDQFTTMSLSDVNMSENKAKLPKSKKQNASSEIREGEIELLELKERQKVLFSNTYIQRQAKARILNERLKRILQIS